MISNLTSKKRNKKKKKKKKINYKPFLLHVCNNFMHKYMSFAAILYTFSLCHEFLYLNEMIYCNMIKFG